MECIVHYDNQKIYSAVKSLSEINLERIKQAKEKRLKIGGINSHNEKCDQIPVNIDTENDVNIPSKPVDVHKEPTKIKGNNVSYREEVEIQVNWKYFVWVYHESNRFHYHSEVFVLLTRPSKRGQHAIR